MIFVALGVGGITAPEIIRRLVDVFKDFFPRMGGRYTLAVAYLLGMIVATVGAFLVPLDFHEPPTYAAILTAGFALADIARARFEAGRRAEAEHQLQTLRDNLQI